MTDLYREYLLDHYKNPRNKGIMHHPDIHKQDVNISCGDEIEMFIKLDKPHENSTAVDDHRIMDVKFDGKGCVVCMASASILTEDIIGKKVRDVKSMDTDAMLKLINLKLTPSRVKCAMLSLVTAKKGILDYEAKSLK